MLVGVLSSNSIVFIFKLAPHGGMNFYLPKTVGGGMFLDSLYVSNKPTLAKNMHMNTYIKEAALS